MNCPTPPVAIIHSILSRATPRPCGSKTEAIIKTSLPTGATTWVGLSETPVCGARIMPLASGGSVGATATGATAAGATGGGGTTGGTTGAAGGSTGAAAGARIQGGRGQRWVGRRIAAVQENMIARRIDPRKTAVAVGAAVAGKCR